MPIRVLLADDEPLARRRLLRFLRSEPDADVVAECASGAEAARVLREGEPVDLALLDVQMPDLDGFGVIAEVGAERMPPVIFVTAYDAYALRAFEVHALDYLLKPVTADRFREAFTRAREHLDRASTASMGRRLKALLANVLASEQGPDGGGAGPAPIIPERQRYADRLTIKDNGRVFFVRVNDVDWFEAHGNYVRVHVGTTTHLIREALSVVEASLSPDRFARIHRSTVVNIDRIRELQPWFAGDYIVLLKDGTQLKLSRTYRDQLQVRLHALS
jgi:two-component system LytT family response regulator